MANMGAGAADLVLLPLKHMRAAARVAPGGGMPSGRRDKGSKGKRRRGIGRGLMKGVASFARAVALEGLRFAAGVAVTTQGALEAVKDVIATPDGAMAVDASGSTTPQQAARSRYASQPANAKEGLSAALGSISRGVRHAANTIVAIPMREYQRSGPQGAVRAVIRAVPIALLHPLIGTSEAVSKTLLGVRNEMDPETRRDVDRRFKPSH